MNFPDISDSSFSSKISQFKSKIKIRQFHFIELYLYYSNFFNDNKEMTTEGFLVATTDLLYRENKNYNKEEFKHTICEMMQDIPKTESNSIDIISLTKYLKEISNTENFDKEYLQKLLLKNKSDLSGFEIFINQLQDSDDDKFKITDSEINILKALNYNKKDIFKNDVFNKVLSLLTYHQKKIEETIQNEYIKKYKKLNFNFPSSIIFKGTTNPPSPIKKRSFEKNCYDRIFDEDKIAKIHEIKLSTFLYDISIEDFLKDFNQYQNTVFNKYSFIFTVSEIIKKNTSNLFNFYDKNLYLSQLFNLIDIDKKNNLNYYEVFGGLCVLFKKDDFDLFDYLITFDREKLTMIFSSIFSLFLNEDFCKDMYLLSSYAVDYIFENNVHNIDDLCKLIKLDSSLLNIKKNIKINTEAKSVNISDNNKLTQIYDEKGFYKMIKEKINNIQYNLLDELSNISISFITTQLINNSILGQMNMHYINMFITSIISYLNISDNKHKENIYNNLWNFLSCFIDLNQDIIFERSQIHSIFLLFFKGTIQEKIESVFNIYEEEYNKGIITDNLNEYFCYLFDSFFTLIGITVDIDTKELSKAIVDKLAEGKKRIKINRIIDQYEVFKDEIDNYE